MAAAPARLSTSLRTLILCLSCLGLPRSAVADQMDNDTRERVRKATGQVGTGEKVQGEDRVEIKGWGSGWFINNTGLMVTNDHVTNQAHYSKNPTEAFENVINIGIPQYEVTLNGGTEEEKTYKAMLMYNNESADLALLQVQDTDGGPLSTPSCLALSPSNEVRTGDRVYVFGYPKGQKMATSKDKRAPVTVSAGNITRIMTSPVGRIKKFKSDAQAAQGNSGGPAVNADGDLIGVLVEGGADVETSGGVSAGLIPADVVGDMIRAALGLNKIETDLVHFMPLLIDRNMNVFVPGRPRLPNQDVIQYKNDSAEMVGKITADEVRLTTPLGKLTVPVSEVGYVLNNNGTAQFLLDGGERLSGHGENVTTKFITDRGTPIDLTVANIRSIVLRKPASRVELPDIEALTIDGEGCRLFIKDVEGLVKFEDDTAGVTEFELQRIRKISSEYYKHVIHKIDGSRLTGKLLPHTLRATLAISGRPIEFTLENLKDRSTFIRRSNPARQDGVMPPLSQRLEIDDFDLEAVAQALDDGNWQKAGALLDELMDEASLRSRTKPVRQQVEVLYAEYLLRKGDFVGAESQFGRLRRAAITGVQSYALGRHHLLKQFPDGQFRGRPLSDPEVFDQAALQTSNAIVDSALEVMVAHGKSDIRRYNDWKNLESKTARMEKDLVIAASMTHGRAERAMFQMLRFRQNRNWAALRMLFNEAEALINDIRTRQANRQNTESLAGKLRRIQSQIATIQLSYAELRGTMDPLTGDLGYRVDDPDASAFLP